MLPNIGSNEIQSQAKESTLHQSAKIVHEVLSNYVYPGLRQDGFVGMINGLMNKEGDPNSTEYIECRIALRNFIKGVYVKVQGLEVDQAQKDKITRIVENFGNSLALNVLPKPVSPAVAQPAA
ncbi:MAG: hypothetical protein WC806_03125 [Candidatus Gracilibacteria bacterium]|jgi:hypothetical protein